MPSPSPAPKPAINPAHPRPVGRGLFFWVTAATLATHAAQATSSAQPSEPPPAQAPAQPDRERLEADRFLTVLAAVDTPPEARRAAAAELLRLNTGASVAGVLAILETARATPSAAGSEAALAIATAAADIPVAPPRLLPALQALAQSPPSLPPAGPGQAPANEIAAQRLRIAAISAIGSIRTRPALRALVSIAGDASTPPDAVQAAYRSLTRASGREDIEPAAGAWSAWVAQVEWLTEAEWRRVLAESLAEQADRAVRVRASATTRLVEYVRREFEASPPEDRGRLLERAMRDDVPAVRRTGFQLAMGELANSRTLDARVAKAALDLLGERDVPTRRAAAELLNITAPPEFAQRIAAALIQETDATTAAWLLRIAARQPEISLIPPVIRWLQAGPPAVGPAIEAAAAMHERGWLESPGDRRRLLDVLRRQPLDEIRPEGARLLFAIGEETDRQAVLNALPALEPGRRTVIGAALVKEAAAVDRLVGMARTDPALLIPAIRALGVHRPLAASYELARELAGPLDDARRAALLELTARLSAGQLLAAARGESDLDLREDMLSRLTTEPLVRRPGPTGGRDPDRVTYTQQPSVVAGLMLLARTRLDLRQPALAMGALDALTPKAVGLDPSERDGLRTIALLWLGRLDDAAALKAPPEAWCEGLERVADMRHAEAVADLIVQRFGDALDDTSRQRIADARRRLSEFTGPRMSP